LRRGPTKSSMRVNVARSCSSWGFSFRLWSCPPSLWRGARRFCRDSPAPGRWIAAGCWVAAAPESRAPVIGSATLPYPVFIVSAEGGGIRAAFWTAGLLCAIQDEEPGFANHVLGISGVSGGSLGAATFAALVAENPACRTRRAPKRRRQWPFAAPRRRGSGQGFSVARAGDHADSGCGRLPAARQMGRGRSRQPVKFILVACFRSPGLRRGLVWERQRLCTAGRGHQPPTRAPAISCRSIRALTGSRPWPGRQGGPRA